MSKKSVKQKFRQLQNMQLSLDDSDDLDGLDDFDEYEDFGDHDFDFDDDEDERRFSARRKIERRRDAKRVRSELDEWENLDNAY
ncbi:MAG: hypothetical protein R3348_07860 [Xanthomonadales bacterium]|nr:hypothetical protein [Xanthomonadales bacterium]